MCSPAEYDKVLCMNRCAVVKGGATRRLARCIYSDCAKLKGMTETQDRAAATRSSTADIRTRLSHAVSSPAEHEIRSEKGSHSLGRHKRR